MPSTRRQFLAVAAAVTPGVAGCVSDAPDRTPPGQTDGTKPSPSPTPTVPPSDRRRRVGGVSVALSDVLVRKAVVYRALMGSGGVVAPADEQFVVAGVHADADLTMDAFELRADERSWTPSVPGDRGGGTYSVAGHEGGPVGGSATGDGPKFVSFVVSSPLELDDAAIQFGRGGETATWSLDDQALATLAAPSPSFRLDELAAPDAVEQGEIMPVELTVTNTSGVAGRFLAAVYWPTELIADDDESHVVEAVADAGETITTSVSIDTDYTTNEDGPVTLSVDGYVTGSTEVEVRDANTPT